MAVVPPIQWALNTAWRPSLEMLSSMAVTGRAPRTTRAMLSEDEEGRVEAKPEDPGKMHECIRRLVAAHDERERQVRARKE